MQEIRNSKRHGHPSSTRNLKTKLKLHFVHSALAAAVADVAKRCIWLMVVEINPR
jgi:hypothetical protein